MYEQIDLDGFWYILIKWLWLKWTTLDGHISLKEYREINTGRQGEMRKNLITREAKIK